MIVTVCKKVFFLIFNTKEVLTDYRIIVYLIYERSQTQCCGTRFLHSCLQYMEQIGTVAYLLFIPLTFDFSNVSRSVYAVLQVIIQLHCWDLLRGNVLYWHHDTCFLSSQSSGVL
jgi:hypothetical protein